MASLLRAGEKDSPEQTFHADDASLFWKGPSCSPAELSTYGTHRVVVPGRGCHRPHIHIRGRGQLRGPQSPSDQEPFPSSAPAPKTQKIGEDQARPHGRVPGGVQEDRGNGRGSKI